MASRSLPPPRVFQKTGLALRVGQLDQATARYRKARPPVPEMKRSVRIRTIHNEPGQCCGPVVDILRKNSLSD